MATEAIGWASAVILLWTIFHQVRKQWLSGESRGVSSWLFIGQSAASLGFSIYSALLQNWIFLFVNVALLFSALAGQAIFMRNRRRQQGAAAARG
jgi:MtN3 and saliva related transmembrane protein